MQTTPTYRNTRFADPGAIGVRGLVDGFVTSAGRDAEKQQKQGTQHQRLLPRRAGLDQQSALVDKRFVDRSGDPWPSAVLR